MRPDRCRRLLTCLGVCIGLAAYASSESGNLTVERSGDQLRLSSAAFHFIEGTPLEQLRNGASVTFVFSVSVAAERGGAAPSRVEEAFAVSYDLWEERFAVTRTRPPAQSVSHLAAAAAEAWCLNALRVPVSAVPAGRTFVIQLDCLVPDAADDRGETPSRLTLSGLLDALSRRGRAASPHWSARSGPLRLADLRDSAR
jgi:hypothetical protein